MSFAIIQTGGKQYKVQTSDIIKVEKLDKDKPGKIEFNEVLAYGDENVIEIGSPTVNGAKVEAELIKNAKKKVNFSPKQDYSNVRLTLDVPADIKVLNDILLTIGDDPSSLFNLTLPSI